MIANYQSTTDIELEKFMCLDDVEDAQENENLEICDIDKMWDALHFLLTGKSASEAIEDNLISEAIVGQFNISGEESKHGFSKEELLELLPELAKLDQIEYVGLMTMAPFEAGSDELKEIFKDTQALQAEIREKQIPNMPMTELSMGMSRDFKEAIQFGSTFVRIGTAFFK